MIYTRAGHSYLICPKLLALDKRHGEHWSKWKPCRRGKKCMHDHEHETELVDPEGHTVNDFYWRAGNLELNEEQHIRCDLCGSKLIHVDLDDPHDPKLLA